MRRTVILLLLAATPLLLAVIYMAGRHEPERPPQHTGATLPMEEEDNGVTLVRQENMQEFEETLMEFTRVRDDLTRTQDSALDTPGVRQAFEEFQDVLLEEMKSIDPQVEGKIERLEELGLKLERMQQEMGGP